MSLLAVVQAYRTTQAQRSFVRCQATYNEVNNERTRALAEATERERHADRRVQEANAALWLNPNLATRKPGEPINPSVLAAFRELQAALQNWQTVTAEADEERRDHPVPPAPSELCGKAGSS
ncbi:MAG TPA: hypothetical protein VIP77_16130 [Jiangellaceae bacterium]